ncbi:hypothetical protein [Bacillus sp. 03113]|uniref:hypothetical protein n=1 Tax=Bacillus sp. 03113 TaxID=2578211 RepID=UPI0015E8E3A4|nr:hypothetical protein [Bacillus sp. 03113]
MKRILFRIFSYIGSNSAYFGSVSLHYELPGDVVDQLMDHDPALPPRMTEGQSLK